MMQEFKKPGTFYLGRLYDATEGSLKNQPFLYPSKNLTTHAVCVGMTGSGKTGLGITLIEEAALSGIPSIIIDPKGDMGNILLTFPEVSAQEFKPWIDQGEAERKGKSLDFYAEEVAKTWKEGLKAWGETPQRIQELRASVSMEIYTPASSAGIPLSILHSFEAPTKEFALDTEAMRERVFSITSSLLGLLGIIADPLKSREHILISTIIAEAWKEGKTLDLAYLIQHVQKPSFDKIGVLDLDTFFPSKERVALSVHLNSLLAAPGFQAWMVGAPLDIQQLLYTPENKPKVSVISIAHLNDTQRMFFVTLFLNQLIAWMRKQPGTSSLRALFYMDEIFGYFPPIASPPSKAPMITLLKQARAYGLGMMLCTQNPVDLDYKGLSNCGTWFIGRLQTARDKARVLEGLQAASNGEIDAKALDKLMSEMSTRVFIMRSIYEKEPVLFQTRWALSYLRGPLTLAQIETLTQENKKNLKMDSTREENEDKAEKPAICGDLPQYFAYVSHADSLLKVEYRPFIAGFSKLHFVDKKRNVDDWVNSCLVVGVQEKQVDWETVENHPDLKQELHTSPVENARFAEVPSFLLNDKKVSGLKNEFINYLYQNTVLKLFEHKELEMLSIASEREEDFRERVLKALNERCEEQIQKVRGEYEKKISTLKEKIRKVTDKKSTQEQQSFYQKMEAFFSFLITCVGALFGRKLTQTTINHAGTTFRRIGRAGKESQEATYTEETLQALQQCLQETSSQLEEEVVRLGRRTEAHALKLDELIIRPRKTDIVIEEIALIWWP